MKNEPKWIEVERMHARMFHDGERIEVIVERWACEGAPSSRRSDPHRVRVIMDVPQMASGKYECEPIECNTLAAARERGRRSLGMHSAVRDGQKVICEASVEIPGFVNIPWPGPSHSEPFFYLGNGGGPALDREIAEMRRKRESLERAGPFLPPPEAAPKTKSAKRTST